MNNPMQQTRLASQRSLLEEDIAAAESLADSLFLNAKYDESLEAAIKSIEHCMKARLQAPDVDKPRLGKKCEQLIRKAEWIKKLQKKALERALDEDRNPTSTPPAPSPSNSETATGRKSLISTNKLTVKEQTLLWKSSKVNGLTYPPWESNPKPSEFFPDGLFSDPSGFLHLSDSQRSMLAAWKRPDEIFEGGEVLFPREGHTLDLTQDVVTDCSVVASLCSAIGREEKGRGKILSNILYPQNKYNCPIISPLGKYIVKFYFNGCFRKVIVDDHLPVSNNSRSLYVTCRNDPKVFYPALIEKAYLKLMGGYDFPGSNSGTDLLALTGWIPEHVFLQSDDVLPGSLWKRMYKAWGHGDVLITLGTGSMTRREELELGLIGDHDYAVLALKEDKGQGMLLVKNPWSEGTVWKGAPVFDSDEEEDFDAGSGVSTFETNRLGHALPAASEEEAAPGVFWISQDNVFRNFASIYLNWNPGLFTHRNDTHFTWDLSGKRSESCIGGNPQYCLENPSAQPALVWLLLGRHIVYTESYKAQAGITNEKTSYISLYVFESPGRRVYRSESALHIGPYVDSPQTLLRIDVMPPKSKYTVAVSSQDLSKTQHTFSLSAFSLNPIHMSRAEDPYGFHNALQSQWLPDTAGGNAQSPTYSTNPQFRLSVPSTCDLMLLLEARDTLPVHVKLVWGNGKRVASVTTRDIITESGEYRRGCAHAETTSLQKGTYTIVASTFEPGQIGGFTLTVASTISRATLTQLPSESAGKLRKDLQGVWEVGVTAVAYPLELERFTRVSANARTLWANSRAQPMLRISIERKIGDRRRKTEASSGGEGEFSDVPQGVRTGDVDLEAGWDYLAVLERMGGEGGSGYGVEVLSDGVVHLGKVVLAEE
ncbi:cysteine proteinase [Tuber magnatum]|uniref:Cysteine proteinase n=1 Tax=Tuber magnatum TaxID=42249 RepID=A0A317T1Q6_9PEZI|nr:cysteine proteinase [Tuber magnatum]